MYFIDFELQLLWPGPDVAAFYKGFREHGFPIKMMINILCAKRGCIFVLLTFFMARVHFFSQKPSTLLTKYLMETHIMHTKKQ